MESRVKIDVVVDCEDWNAVGLVALAGEACSAALTIIGLPADRFEISLLGCDDTRIAVLNADFRGKAQATNVLSWPAGDIGLPLGQMPDLPTPDPVGPLEELGDIAIAYQTCVTEASAQNKPIENHVRHLLVHGTLHLLGFDHILDQDAALMEGLETRVLATLGVPDPY